MPWLSYDEAMAHLPQARWMAATARKETTGISALRVHDGESALESIIAGVGKTLIPQAIGDADDRLIRITNNETPELTRELWLLGHVDDRNLGRVKAVRAWIEAVFS